MWGEVGVPKGKLLCGSLQTANVVKVGGRFVSAMPAQPLKPSLFCFAVVRPGTAEVPLLDLHLTLGDMLAGCDWGHTHRPSV